MILMLLAAAVVILSLCAGVAGLTLGVEPSSRVVQARIAPILDRERDLARTFGLSGAAWCGIRLAALAMTTWVVVIAKVPAVAVVGVLTGIFGVPWMLGGVAARRRVQMARALKDTLVDVANRLESSGSPMDAVLRDVARHPRPEIARLMTPLVTADSVDGALAAGAAESGSPLVEHAYLLVAACRTRSSPSLVGLLRGVEIPQLEAALEEAEQARVTQATARRTTIMMGGLLFGAVLEANSVASFHRFYTSAAGEVALAMVALVFAGSMATMSVLTRPAQPVRWNVHQARIELERLRRG